MGMRGVRAYVLSPSLPDSPAAAKSGPLPQDARDQGRGH